MDDTNFRISGDTANKKRLSVRPKARLDWHYDIRALKGIIRKVIGMKVDERVTFNVYGSNLNQGHVYQDLRLYCSRFWNFPWKRNRVEKQVDTTIIRDMALDAVHLQESKETAAFFLVSGDNDMLPAVIYAVQCGYTVHVWAWEDSVSVALTMANCSIPVGKLLFPPNGVVLFNPWHELPEVLSQFGDKLGSSNMTFMQSSDHGGCPDIDIVVVPEKRVRNQDARLRSMLEDFEKNGVLFMGHLAS
ncbi:uncharacterized protein FOBCDRAFT_203565 [Fusarium oxysporum Fo47]|uniref:uncharacterized protein n=1 Tax=Fusarium oxysporum Fo47 TaxID=660027 RepID=UPI002869DFEC|nr:uncharacterized protein FOBCDRAFT_203565 [Fusarium oxysporum Fo47]QKD56494.2 hypothetical protein FOBCDRAFT_203565 [Fusarium oxysporum Fo47]